MLRSGDIRRGVFGVFLCLLSSGVLAAEQRLDASLSSSMRYNDNLRLFSNVKDSATAVTLQPKIKMKMDEDIWDFNMDGSLRASRYVSDATLNNDSVFFTASGAYKTELSQYRLNIRNDDVASLNRSAKTILLDTGVENEQWNRKTQTIGGSWKRQLSEDMDISLSLDKTQVSYSGRVPTGYSGYDTDNAGLTYGWAATERSRFDATVSFMRFTNEVNTFSYDQTVYQLSYGYALSQAASFRVSAGKRVLKSTFYNQLIGCDLVNPFDGSCLLNPVFGDIDTKNDGNVVSASLNSSSELSKYGLDLSRTIIPSSVSGAQQQDRISFNYEYYFSTRISAAMQANGTKSLTIEGSNTSRDSKRELLNMSLRYQLSRDMSLRFSYQYINSQYLSDGIDRRSNTISINLYTAWPRLMSTY